MPPSTDCSAATSCGGCRSYSGAVGLGRLNSSATATRAPPSPARRARDRHSAGGKPGGRRAPPDRTCVRVDCYRRAPTVRRPAAAGEDVRKRGAAPSNTAVHPVLHNLWTSRWTGACRHVETDGGQPGGRLPARQPSPARTPPTGCGRRSSPEVLSRCRTRVSPCRTADRRRPHVAATPARQLGTSRPAPSRAGRGTGRRAHAEPAERPENAARGAGPESDAPRGRCVRSSRSAGTTSIVSWVVTSGCTRTVTVCCRWS